MKTEKTLIIIGAGGFGAEALWVAREMNRISSGEDGWQIAGFCDEDDGQASAVIDGMGVIGPPEIVFREFAGAGAFFHCAVGDNRQRRRLAELFEARGFSPATLVHPAVVVGPGTVIGAGSYIGAGSILSPHARIGRHVLINVLCSIGHDATLDDYCQISPGGRVLGCCRLKTGATMGSNSVLMQGRTLGEFATLGAASFAITDVPAGATAIGAPAHVMLRHD